VTGLSKKSDSNMDWLARLLHFLVEPNLIFQLILFYFIF